MSVPPGHDTGDPELGGGTRVFSNPLSIASLVRGARSVGPGSARGWNLSHSAHAQEQDGDRAYEADISGTLSPTKRSSKAPRYAARSGVECATGRGCC